MALARVSSALVTVSAGWVLMTCFVGCQAGDPLEKSGVELTAPGLWQRVERTRWLVPGTPLAAWSGPEGSSLVVYQGLPAPGVSAESIADGLANRLTNLPDLKVVVKRLETIAGQSAARVEVIAPGDGGSLAPSGVGKPVARDGEPLVPTRQITLALVRSDGPVFLSWHSPEQAHARIVPGIEAVLKSLRLSADSRPPAQKY